VTSSSVVFFFFFLIVVTEIAGFDGFVVINSDDCGGENEKKRGSED